MNKVANPFAIRPGAVVPVSKARQAQLSDLQHIADAIVPNHWRAHRNYLERRAEWIARSRGDQTTVQAEARAFVKAMKRRDDNLECAVQLPKVDLPALVKVPAPVEIDDEDTSLVYDLGVTVLVVVRRDSGIGDWAERVLAAVPTATEGDVLPLPMYGTRPIASLKPSAPSPADRGTVHPTPATSKETNMPRVKKTAATTEKKTRVRKAVVKTAGRVRGKAAAKPATRTRKPKAQAEPVAAEPKKRRTPLVEPATPRKANRYVMVAEDIPATMGATQCRAILQVVKDSGDAGVTAADIRTVLGPKFSPDPASTVAFHLTQSKNKGLIAAKRDEA